jgi:hypothetical protein
MNNNKFIGILLLALLPAFVFAQEIKMSGEAKTGIYYRKTEQAGADPYAYVSMHNADDAGGANDKTANPGRFRLNIEYDNGNSVGMKTRINWENWGPNNSTSPPTWSYAFAYGNYFDNQLSLSVGKLGGSPWGTGGPEMWKELEDGVGGMRTEFKPAFVPGQLNVGFVFNTFNSDRDQGFDADKPVSLLNIMRESVIGVSYTHDMFLIRMAYRFDDEMDAQQDNKLTGSKEDEFIYRVEERVIQNYLPGFQIWALGHFFAFASEEIRWLRNWLFVQYAPDLFTAQIRFGYDKIINRSEVYVKPSFYLNLLEKMISVGAAFQYAQDFGDGKVNEDAPYHTMEIEPKLQINLPSSYIAFAYNWKQEYINPNLVPEGKEPIKRTQWMNLRYCIYF